MQFNKLFVQYAILLNQFKNIYHICCGLKCKRSDTDSKRSYRICIRYNFSDTDMDTDSFEYEYGSDNLSTFSNSDSNEIGYYPIRLHP